MKRLILLLVFLSLALPGTASGAENTVIEIRGREDLLDAANHPGMSFRLMNDIDLQGENWTPVPFSGELDGNGFGIYNMTVTRTGDEIRTTVDGNRKQYDTRFAGLFSVAEDAVIRNLKIIGAHVAVEGETHCFAAVLTGYAKYCTFENITVEGRVRLDNDAVMAGVGGIAGFGSGTFDNCHARVEMVFADRNLTSRCEEFMGAMMACGYTRVQNCTVDIDGYVSCFGYCHSGGLMGLYYFCGTKYQLGPENRIINHNTVNGRIYFFEHNPDRRAYCSGAVGETLTQLASIKPNNTQGFVRKETKDASRILLPETCENPVWLDTVVPPSGSEWGWTEHTCAGCGYTWRDSYTAP